MRVSGSNVRRLARAVGLGMGPALFWAVGASAQPAASTGALRAEKPELRALWVDAFHAGIRSPEEVALLIDDAKRIHVNTLIVQVRRRGDALYASVLEPPLDDPNFDPSFDALAHVVEKAHASGLQVHAWINAMPLWRDEAPPKDARHIFNLHGPATTGEQCWLTSARDGRQKFPVGFFLDPGHPQAQNHLVSVYLDIVRRYAVDGIHFDYIRYPETESPVPPRGADVGYNAVSVARFQRATGRTDVPALDDEAWIRWRREQVTQLMRRISIEARAINPRIKVSAAVIAWGKPPASLGDFEKVSPMQRIFQDWRGWLVEGLLDLAVPMNYAREHDQTVRGWFNGWIVWEKRYKADRQLAVGVGGYLSAPEGVLAQVSRVRASSGRARADGLSLFSYFRPSLPPGAPTTPGKPAPEPTRAAPDRLDFLVAGAGSMPPAFIAPAPVPAMPWVERPTTGFIAGTVTDPTGRAVEAATVQIRRTGWFRRTRRATSDANGWFGMTQLKPGTYRIRVEDRAGHVACSATVVDVRAGAVARVGCRASVPGAMSRG